MRRSIAIGCTLLVLGCFQGVVRDEAVYRNEVLFNEALAMKQAVAIHQLIASACYCIETDKGLVFSGRVCEDAAMLVQLTRARVPWHSQMMLHLAGLEGHPGETPPIIQSGNLLCE
tara:strand:+ start:329 stop:676 length:348 start_codon:yes stop_codon:yes gene_type:complete